MSIRKRYKQGGWQVRIEGAPAQTLPTREAARAVELDLKLRRSLGDLYEEAPTSLGDEMAGFIAAKKAAGKVGVRGEEFLRTSERFWQPFASAPVPSLRRAALEDALTSRAAAHPRSAQRDRQFLLAVLRRAEGRGQRVDHRIFGIDAVEVRPRRGRALTVPQVWFLGSCAPEEVRRLVVLAGFVGARQHFWLSLTDDMLDLDAGTMLAPAELQKNRRDHVVYLAPVEVRLFREQLVARAPGTRLVFPRADGRAWATEKTAGRHSFGHLVWRRTVAMAAALDRQENGVEASVFDGFTFHGLRHTAGSLMAAAGLDVAVAAERMGHTDGGALFLRTYRHLYEAERKAAALRFGAALEALGDEEAVSA